MKIVVFDVPAEHSGALTILEMYYNRACLDKENEYVFVLSIPQFKEQENIKIINFPWIKKSWFHRLFFDYFLAPRIVKKLNPKQIISLQNTIIKNYKYQVHQTLYLHQALPFVEKKFSMQESFKFWVYQNLISRLIFKSLKRADKIIVQTSWMKEACLNTLKIESSKINIQQPDISIKVKNRFKKHNSDKNKYFVYPASGLKYKNHEVIVKAISKIDFKNIVIYFTLDGNESEYIKSLRATVESNNFPIKFIGHKNIEEIYEMYGYCTLLFPSYIETFGLPLLEARKHGSPIIASNCAFSKEILDGYENVSFFDPNDSDELSGIMEKHIGY